MNEHAFQQKEDRQPSYGLIYNTKPVKLETLKTYIKTYLKTGFTQRLAGAVAFFHPKPDGNLCLYIDY